MTLKTSLESDGWTHSLLEPALFYWRPQGELKGVLVSHVDDVQAGVLPRWGKRPSPELTRTLSSLRARKGATYTFRGRVVMQLDGGEIRASMRNYA